MLPIIDDVFNSATVAGAAVGGFAVVLSVFWSRLGDAAAPVFCVYAAGLIGLAAAMTVIYLAGRSTAEGQGAVIVLGCSVKGSRPNLSLISRTRAASKFLTDNPAASAILSGGQGADEDISEARCMFELLTDMGIDGNRLMLEDKSTTTEENIRFSAELLRNMAASGEVAVATSEYHQLRAGMICRRYGLKAYKCSSKTKLRILPVFLLREAFAVAKEILCYKFCK